MKTIEFHIQGMHCDGCAKTIEALLATETGVKAASANFSSARARVLYDPATIDTAKLVAAIEKGGYKVTSTI